MCLQGVKIPLEPRHVVEYAAWDDGQVHPINRLLREHVTYNEEADPMNRRGPRIGPTSVEQIMGGDDAARLQVHSRRMGGAAVLSCGSVLSTNCGCPLLPENVAHNWCPLLLIAAYPCLQRWCCIFVCRFSFHNLCLIWLLTFALCLHQVIADHQTTIAAVADTFERMNTEDWNAYETAGRRKGSAEERTNWDKEAQRQAKADEKSSWTDRIIVSQDVQVCDT